MVLSLRGTIRKLVIFIRLLWVGIWADLSNTWKEKQRRNTMRSRSCQQNSKIDTETDRVGRKVKTSILRSLRIEPIKTSVRDVTLYPHLPRIKIMIE
jgi:hypothetical protein